MTVNRSYSNPSLKHDSVNLLRDLAFTEDNNLSKELRLVCRFYIESKSIILKTKQEAEIVNPN